ncbi:hypothetical protein SAMN05444521_0740 [Streptomyces sp. 3214.6]|nr:hypothetical protein SAMN05444521_0740 [Streptomyces sp. 3214.6]
MAGPPLASTHRTSLRGQKRGAKAAYRPALTTGAVSEPALAGMPAPGPVESGARDPA